MRDEIIIAIITIAMIAVAIPFMIRSLLWNRILKQLHKGDYDDVLKRLHSMPYRLLFTAYDRHYNCLQVYLATSDNQCIEKQMDTLLTMNLSERQAYQVASQTYFYFLEKEQKAMCIKLLSLIEKKADCETIAYNQMLFRILIEKRGDDIEFLKQMLQNLEQEPIKKDQADDQQKKIGLLQYLLGLQYSYQKECKQMNYYLQKAKANLKGTPYQKKVKQLLHP